MEEKEKILKAIANKRRLAIVRYLKIRREATVGDISEEIKLSFRSTSKHLAILLAADILARTQVSLEMHYRLSDSMNLFASSVMRLL